MYSLEDHILYALWMVLSNRPPQEGAHHASARFGPGFMHVKDAQSTSSCPIMLGIILNVYESRVITGSLLRRKLPQTLGLRVKLADRITFKKRKERKE